MSKGGIENRRTGPDEIAFEAWQRWAENDPQCELLRRKHAEEEARKNPDQTDWIRNQSQ